MFSYVCPKCGKDVPPAYSECPNCAMKEGRAPSVGGPVVEPLPKTAPPPAQATPPQVAPAPPVMPPPPVQAAPTVYPPPAPPPSQPSHGQQPQYPPTPPYAQPGYAVQQKAGLPGWAVALIVGGVLILGGYLLIVKGLPWWRERGNTVAAAETNEAPASAAPAAISADDTLKHLEVTGLRISEVNRKPHISMVVVNHASAELTDINANVLVRTTKDRAGAPALAKLQLKLSSIGANDVKEVSMPFPTTLRAYELPDWQFLRAEVSH